MPVFGLGCAGGVNGLATAARLAASDPGTRWLFVTIETCSISIRLDSDDPAAVVATAIFGDGAAAAVVQCGGERARDDHGRGGEALARHAADHGLGCRGSRAEGRSSTAQSRPSSRQNLEAAVEEILRAIGQPRDAIARLCCHPGGVKVIDAIETALGLTSGALDVEREVLRDYGNMSAPTVMFVLEKLIDRGLPRTVLMTAFGPGFTCGGLLLEAA